MRRSDLRLLTIERKAVVGTILKNVKKTERPYRILRPYKDTLHGPSDRVRTCGLMVPNHPRSQLRYTRIYSVSAGGGREGTSRPSGLCRRQIKERAHFICRRCRACRTMLLYRAAAGMSSSRFFEQGYPGVSGNGPPFVDAGVLSAGHPGVSGDDRSGTGRAGSRPGYPGVMVYSAAAAHIDEGEHP